MDTEVPVKLTDTEIAERAQVMAAKVLHVDHLRKKKATDAKNTQVLIDADLDEIARLARVITEAQEGRRQGELFANQDTATRTLAEVGKGACTCPPSGRLVDCAVHRDERTSARHGVTAPLSSAANPGDLRDGAGAWRDEPSPQDRDGEADFDEPVGGEA